MTTDQTKHKQKQLPLIAIGPAKENETEIFEIVTLKGDEDDSMLPYKTI